MDIEEAPAEAIRAALAYAAETGRQRAGYDGD
jgi:hypothetical protein